MSIYLQSPSLPWGCTTRDCDGDYPSRELPDVRCDCGCGEWYPELDTVTDRMSGGIIAVACWPDYAKQMLKDNPDMPEDERDYYLSRNPR